MKACHERPYGADAMVGCMVNAEEGSCASEFRSELRQEVAVRFARLEEQVVKRMGVMGSLFLSL